MKPAANQFRPNFPFRGPGGNTRRDFSGVKRFPVSNEKNRYAKKRFEPPAGESKLDMYYKFQEAFFQENGEYYKGNDISFMEGYYQNYVLNKNRPLPTPPAPSQLNTFPSNNQVSDEGVPIVFGNKSPIDFGMQNVRNNFSNSVRPQGFLPQPNAFMRPSFERFPFVFPAPPFVRPNFTTPPENAANIEILRNLPPKKRMLPNTSSYNQENQKAETVTHRHFHRKRKKTKKTPVEEEGEVSDTEYESCGEFDSNAEEVFDKEDDVANESDLKEKPIVTKTSEQPPFFIDIIENVYLFAHDQRQRSKARKEHKRMVCDCEIPEDDSDGDIVEHLCGSGCLNRLLLIECSKYCPVGDLCTNRRFQKRQYAKLTPFKTEKKGWGVKALEFIPKGSFIIEFVGEVLAQKQFYHKVKEYKRKNMEHFYFMALKSDEIIDATSKGNISRFINHSCSPNCETQKWTVDGLLRLGFFATEDIQADTELAFDYQFENYGRRAQKCYCESSNCKGWIGGDKENGSNNKSQRKYEDEVNDILEQQITDMLLQCWDTGLRSREQVLKLARLMVRVETYQHRNQLLYVLKKTSSDTCLEEFLRYHGLSLLWSWMVDPGEKAPLEFLLEILDVLKILPIKNKTCVEQSKLLSVVEKWSKDYASFKMKTRAQQSDSDDLDERSVSSLTSSTSSAAKMPLKKKILRKEFNAESDKQKKYEQEEGECEDDKKDEERRAMTEDEIKESIGQDAQSLFNAWSQLKELFKIPKTDGKEIRDPRNRVFRDRVSENANRKRNREMNDKLLTSSEKIPKKSERLDASEKLQRRREFEERFTTPSRVQSQVGGVWDSLSETLKEADQYYGSIGESESSNKPPSPDSQFNPTNSNNLPKMPAMPPMEPIPAPALPVMPPAFPPVPSVPTPIQTQPAMVFQPGQTIYIQTPNGQLIPQQIQAPGMISSTPLMMQTSQGLVIQQPMMVVPKEELSPSKEPAKLPPNWRKTRDSENRVYYYHAVTRQTQWEPPTWDGTEDESKETNTTTAAADTSSERLRKVKEKFRVKIAQFISHCLNPYLKNTCVVGRITNKDDFKHLCRKMTHTVLAKEMKNLKNIEDLCVNDSVKSKTKDYVKKYMSRIGTTYKRNPSSPTFDLHH